MKHLPKIAGALLGLAFIIFGLNFFFKFLPMDPPEKGTPPALFMAALVPTGFLAVVKVMEILGGIAVAIPKTRNLGLLLLGPVIVNILLFNALLTPGGAGLFQPPVIVIAVLGAFLLWVERRNWLGLLIK